VQSVAVVKAWRREITPPRARGRREKVKGLRVRRRMRKTFKKREPGRRPRS